MMNDNEFNQWKEGCIYKPTGNWEPKAQNATLAVKFSNDIFVGKSQCDKWNIPYNEEDLEDTIIGKALRIKQSPSGCKPDE